MRRARIFILARRRDWRWLWLRRKEVGVELYRGPVEEWPSPSEPPGKL